MSLLAKLLGLGISVGAFLASAPVPSVAQRLGSVTFPTSGTASAQKEFLRGVLYLHSFEYDSAGRAFHRAQAADPDFAMAYWGEALSHTHPVWNEQDVAAARGVLDRLGPGRQARLAKARTARERAYLE